MNDTYAKILMMGTAEVYENIAKSYESLARWKEHRRNYE
jgi:hypothetical protein